MQDKAVACSEIWQAADPLESPVSMEERLRGGDRKIEACLLVETLRLPDASQIAVSVSSGEVTLSGTVDNREGKHRAEYMAMARDLGGRLGHARRAGGFGHARALELDPLDQGARAFRQGRHLR